MRTAMGLAVLVPSTEGLTLYVADNLVAATSKPELGGQDRMRAGTLLSVTSIKNTGRRVILQRTKR